MDGVAEVVDQKVSVVAVLEEIEGGREWGNGGKEGQERGGERKRGMGERGREGNDVENS